MKWDLEPEQKQSKKALAELKKAIEKGYGKPCKKRAVGCSTCLAWAVYDMAKLKLY